MSEGNDGRSIDLVRWSFTINPEHRAAIEGHLVDLGLEVVVVDDDKFGVSWEEPDENFEEVIEELWALHGEPFEVTQEEFHRLGLHTLHHDESASTQEAA
jgi:hypothetical protein